MTVALAAGLTSGRLTLIESTYVRDKNGDVIWRARCSCGKELLMAGRRLRNGNTRSCGCLYRESRRTLGLTHGRRYSPEYAIWNMMKQRCLNPRCKDYKYYGDRGIRVCERWLASFANFLDDMGPRLTSDLSIERQDNSRGYEPGNCVWAPRVVQQRNTRSNVDIDVCGRSQCVAAWIRELGVKRWRIHWMCKREPSKTRVILSLMREVAAANSGSSLAERTR